MKSTVYLVLSGLTLSLVGCTTSSQVQEMIDVSYREQTDRSDSHETSINELRKSALISLEKSKENADVLTQIQAELEALNNQVNVNKGFAESSKVSAANTVKVAELDELLKANTEADEKARERLMKIDRLYESVMISHYQMIADSANNAIENLKSDGWIGSSNAPVKIDEPIEIIAPPTNPVPKQ